MSLFSILNMQSALGYQMGDDFPFGSPCIRFNVSKGNVPSDKQKHQPFGWVKYADKYISISAIDSNNDYEIDFDDYTFADSTPFGVKIEE